MADKETLRGPELKRWIGGEKGGKNEGRRGGWRKWRCVKALLELKKCRDLLPVRGKRKVSARAAGGGTGPEKTCELGERSFASQRHYRSKMEDGGGGKTEFRGRRAKR